jgi:hypothetical protein
MFDLTLESLDELIECYTDPDGNVDWAGVMLELDSIEEYALFEDA